jgi:hypothetical protein
VRQVPASAGIGRPYDLQHSFASVLIHEGRSLAEVTVQLGDAVATVASSTRMRLSKQRRCRVSRQLTRSTQLAWQLVLRQMYVRLVVAPRGGGDARDPASGEKADARTRAGDPFITRELKRSGAVCRQGAGSGLGRREKFSMPGDFAAFLHDAGFARLGTDWAHLRLLRVT